MALCAGSLLHSPTTPFVFLPAQNAYACAVNSSDRIAEQMNELRQRFRVRCSERGAALADACEKADMEAIRSLAHDITGSAGLFGFPDLSQEARRLSDACRLCSDDEAVEAGRALSASLLAAARGD
jgi:HPt (histidine-containing phosphotransfer) domain-containing protein